MPALFDVRNVLQLIVDRLDDESLPEHELVLHSVPHHIGHQLNPGDDLFFTDVSPVTIDFSGEIFAKFPDRNPVVGVPPGEFEGEQVADLVDNDMKLESVKPSHAAFPSGGKPLEDFVPRDSDVFADPYGGGIDESYAGIGTSAALEIMGEG